MGKSSRCFCFTPVLSVPTVHAMETGPLLFAHTSIYKFPPFSLVGKALRKSHEDKVNAIVITYFFVIHTLSSSTAK